MPNAYINAILSLLTCTKDSVQVNISYPIQLEKKEKKKKTDPVIPTNFDPQLKQTFLYIKIPTITQL